MELKFFKNPDVSEKIPLLIDSTESETQEEVQQSAKRHRPTDKNSSTKSVKRSTTPPKPSIERLVLNGGGARGMAYSGAYKALKETGIFQGIEQIAGSSVGALAATFMAVGMDVEQMNNLLSTTNFHSLLGNRIGKFFGKNDFGVCFITKDSNPLENFIRTHINLSISKFLTAHFETDLIKKHPQLRLIQEKFREPIPRLTFGDLHLLHRIFPDVFKQLIIPLVHFPKGMLHIFNDKNTPQVDIATVCYAACCMPIISKPVAIDLGDGQGFQQFMDGGIYDNLPKDYFDSDCNNLFIKNTKPTQTLIFAFSGTLDKKNPIFRSLYGARWDEVNNSPPPVLYRPSIIEWLKRNLLVKWLGDFKAPYKNTIRKELGYQEVREKYCLRTVNLQVTNIETTDFEKAMRNASIISATGYLDTISYIINHELYDDHTFNAYKFYADVMKYFEPKYRTALHQQRKTPEKDYLSQQIAGLKKQLQGTMHPIISQQAYYLVRDQVKKNLQSVEAITLSDTIKQINNSVNETNSDDHPFLSRSIK